MAVTITIHTQRRNLWFFKLNLSWLSPNCYKMSVSTEACDTRTNSIQESRLVKVHSYKCRKRAKPPNATPVILALILVCCSSTTVQGQSLLPKVSLTEFNQTSIKDDVTFTLDQSPYLIIEDVIVHRTGIFCHCS